LGLRFVPQVVKSKRQLILEYRQTHGLENAGAQEIRLIQAELGRTGSGQRLSLSYIASVLRQAGTRVDFNSRYVDPWMEEPYATRLTGLLQFRDLETTEGALCNLDQAYREYQKAADRKGVTLVRSLGLKGKLRAEGLAANPRVSPERRAEKREIASWFRVWLENPDIFFDWLEVRKRSEEFQTTFARPGSHTPPSPERED
jgi:hypothetical protein